MTPAERAEADRIEQRHPGWKIAEHTTPGTKRLFCAETGTAIHLAAPTLDGVERSIADEPGERAA